MAKTTLAKLRTIIKLADFADGISRGRIRNRAFVAVNNIG